MIINEYGSVEEMRPFELLKLIRDGVVVKEGEVFNYFVNSQIDHSPIDVIEVLRELGWIEVSKERDIKPTERMLRALRGLNFSLTRLAPYGANSIVTNPLFGRPKVPPMPSDLFVIMPFAEELRAVYDDHIRPVADRLGIISTRGDDFLAANSIISDVWNAITHAKVLVADCTGRNPNVFYELGIAHTLGKPVILIAQDKDDIPFDIQHIRIILYNFTPRGMLDFEHTLEATVKRELETPRTLADVLSWRRRPQHEATATGSQKPNVSSTASDPLETLPPITVELKDEILNALKMTDKLDALYKRGCTSAEFIAAATPLEGVFMNLSKKLKGDPRRALLVNTFKSYQRTAVEMVAYEQGKRPVQGTSEWMFGSQRPDGFFAVAFLRKGSLMKVFEGNMTANEKESFRYWLHSLGHSEYP